MFKLLVHQNIRSLIKNFSQLEAYLTNSDKPSIIALTETWLKPYSNTACYKLNGYQELIAVSRKKRGGGVAFYVEIGKRANKVLEFVSEDTQMLTIFVDDKYLVTVVYKTPQAKLEDFLNALTDYLLQIERLKTSQRHVICGDFNIDMLIENDASRQLQTTIEIFGLSLSIKEALPTRPTVNGGSMIDLCFSNHDMVTKIEKTTITDHRTLVCYYTATESKNTERMRTVRFWKKVESQQMKDKINFYFQHELSKISKALMEEQIDVAFDLLHSLIISVKEKFVPLKDIKMDPQDKKKNWVDNKVKKECRKKQKRYEEYLRIKTAWSWERFKLQRSKTENVIRNSKRKHFDKVLSSHEDNGNRTFYRVMKTFNKSQTNIDSEELPDKNDLNDFFSTIGSKLKESLSSTHTPIKISKILNTIYLKETTETEIFEIISGLKTKNSEDENGISIRLLKLLNSTIAGPIAQLINRCIHLRCFPSILKTAKVIPLYKDGSKSDCSNYRPISLLPTIGKLYERVLNAQILDFFNKHDIISHRQFGFRAKRNTVDAIAEVIENLRNSIIDKSSASCVFVDLKKAFDTVDYDILLTKCEAYGLRGPIHAILTSYLQDRKQFVSTHRGQSGIKSITCGVPQGSVLGPLLFLIYVNDLPQVCTESTVTLFADDTCVMGAHHQEHEIKYQNDLNNMQNWLDTNKLTLNSDKTKLIIPTNHKAKFQLRDKLIEIVEEIKYLGLIIDKKLQFKKHIRTLIRRIMANVQPLRYFKTFISEKRMLQAYKVYIQPIIQYGVLIYGTTNKSNLMPLERVQKLVWRIIFGIRKYDSINAIRQKHKLLNVRELHVYELLKILSKNLRNNDGTNLLCNIIKPKEINFEGKRKKMLKNSKLRTSESQKLIYTRVRKLHNILNRWDENITNSLRMVSNKSLNALLHKYRDTIICDNDELTNMFW